MRACASSAISRRCAEARHRVGEVDAVRPVHRRRARRVAAAGQLEPEVAVVQDVAEGQAHGRTIVIGFGHPTMPEGPESSI
jgi:hypothetical protein